VGILRERQVCSPPTSYWIAGIELRTDKTRLVSNIHNITTKESNNDECSPLNMDQPDPHLCNPEPLSTGY
jgi:hypothetical protein